MTLIELIIVIAIIGILAAISIPKNNMRHYRLDSKVKILTSDIRKVRYKVMTQGGRDNIVLRENSYIISNGSTLNNVVEFGEDISIGDNLGKQVRFNPSGTPKNSGSITIEDVITLKRYEITIVPHTGRILLIEY